MIVEIAFAHRKSARRGQRDCQVKGYITCPFRSTITMRVVVTELIILTRWLCNSTKKSTRLYAGALKSKCKNFTSFIASRRPEKCTRQFPERRKFLFFVFEHERIMKEDWVPLPSSWHMEDTKFLYPHANTKKTQSSFTLMLTQKKTQSPFTPMLTQRRHKIPLPSC